VSDDSLDYELEEKLKAEHGYRELWVRFTDGNPVRVRTFPETPEWVEACDRAALDLVADPQIAEVWSVPMGMGNPPGSLGADAPTSIGAVGGVQTGPATGERTSSNNDASDRSPSCCEPRRSIGPSGVRLRHAWDCTKRGAPYSEAKRTPLHRPDRIARRHDIETRRVGLDTDQAFEGAGGVLTVVGAECPAHPSMPAYECPTCSERRV